MVILKNKKGILTITVVAVLLAVTVINILVVHMEAKGLSKACQNSTACMEAVAKEEEANKNAAAAAESADAFQAKVM